MIQAIMEAAKATLQAENRLASITNYHLVDGMVPGVKPTASICCSKLRYSDYDRDQDEVIAPLRVYVYVKDMQAERGEATIRSLTEEIRWTLLADPYLGGLVDVLTITDITFESDQTQDSQLLHYALVDLEVKFYSPRQRPPGDPIPTAQLVESTLNTESFEIDL